MTFSGLLLAGGAGRRMGGNKHRRCVAGKPLLQHALDYLRPQCATIRVAGADDWIDSFLGPGELRIADAMPHVGPLGGVLSGLQRAETPWTLLSAVDLPFLPAGLGNWMLPYTFPETLALVPCPACGPQPLAALLHQRLIPSLTNYLTGGERRVLGWLSALGPQVRWLSELPQSRADAFANLNFLVDLKD
jgi:molybdopterin-guanine dinucleotide biosynthesis protein A